jgi:cytoskeletal protein CcmA (bactofilin family)
MEVESQKHIKSIKSFWTKYEYKIVLLIGFLLVAIVSFEFGYVRAGNINSNPIVIEKSAASPEISLEGQVGGIIKSESAASEKTSVEADSQVATTPLDCAFVGSKNSNKYYPPTCSYAKRIKPENLACFKTAAEAVAQGRIVSTGCKY